MLLTLRRATKNPPPPAPHSVPPRISSEIAENICLTSAGSLPEKGSIIYFQKVIFFNYDYKNIPPRNTRQYKFFYKTFLELDISFLLLILFPFPDEYNV